MRQALEKAPASCFAVLKKQMDMYDSSIGTDYLFVNLGKILIFVHNCIIIK